ncbi:MAG: hypothetical protein KGQ37_08920 [Hyphomicrobiales bacterium]|nr:hypothetical protein [Hyphomicrobiales bacterium]
MRNILLIATALTLPALAGCATERENNAAGGAILGGTAGAIIGGVSTNSVGGAAVGGVLGAAGGAIVGSALTPHRRCVRYGYDYNGNRVCLRVARY